MTKICSATTMKTMIIPSFQEIHSNNEYPVSQTKERLNIKKSYWDMKTYWVNQIGQIINGSYGDFVEAYSERVWITNGIVRTKYTIEHKIEADGDSIYLIRDWGKDGEVIDRYYSQNDATFALYDLFELDMYENHHPMKFYASNYNSLISDIQSAGIAVCNDVVIENLNYWGK